MTKKPPTKHPLPEKIRTTAGLIQAEIIEIATQALLTSHQELQPRPEFYIPYRVARGGLRRLCKEIARNMLLLGDGKASAQPTLRQQQIAANFHEMRRGQRRRTVMVALRGHKISYIQSLRRTPYPALPGYRQAVDDERPFIYWDTRGRLGRRAAALLVRTNPTTRPIVVERHRGIASVQVPATPDQPSPPQDPDEPLQHRAPQQ